MIIPTKSPPQLALQMLRKRKPWLDKTVRLFADALDALKMKVLMVVIANSFTDEKTNDHTLQQRAYCSNKD